MNSNYLYCIDSSSLIDLKPYFSEIFKSLWKDIEELINQSRLISPFEVLREIENYDDEVADWARKHKGLFKQLNSEQLYAVSKILSKFPNLIDPDKKIPDADPFIIALALVRQDEMGSLLGDKCMVVTQEKPTKGARPKIPDVCKHFGIEYIGIREMLNRENWRY